MTQEAKWREEFEAEYPKGAHTLHEFGAFSAAKRQDAVRIAELEISNTLYKADADRIWAMMPELQDTECHYELHEAVKEKLEAASKERDELAAQVEVMRELLANVGTREWDGIFCKDVAGRNWFDSRDRALSITSADAMLAAAHKP